MEAEGKIQGKIFRGDKIQRDSNDEIDILICHHARAEPNPEAELSTWG